MATWIWKSWAGHKRAFEADHVTFSGEHVQFWRSRPDALVDELLLAIKNSDVNDLHPIEQGEPEWWR